MICSVGVASFATDLFSALGVQRLEKIVERLVALIEPVVLAGFADQQLLIRKVFALFGRRKQAVKRRSVVGVDHFLHD